MARRLSRSSRRRRTRSRRSWEIGPFLGLATKQRLQPRQRKLGEPAWVLPLRTTWVAWQRGQGGIGSIAAIVVGIRRDYKYPSGWATTRPRDRRRRLRDAGAVAPEPQHPAGKHDVPECAQLDHQR